MEGTEAVAAQAAMSTDGGGKAGMRMAADCPTCPMSGACIAAMANEPFAAASPWLQFPQPPSPHADRVLAPDTAPPKRFSV